MKVVINRCFGWFGLSEQAYEWLIAHGVPVRQYIEQKRGANGLYLPEPLNDGEIIFDRTLTPQGTDKLNDLYYQYGAQALGGRYWDSWTASNRTHPLVVGVVEALGKAANSRHADLHIVEIPDGTDYEIEEYDGNEHIAEAHRTWR